MGWFGSSKPEEPSAISRQSRAKCWEHRDTYFACLDAAGVVKAGEEGGACAKEEAGYAQNCAKSWIEYFNQRRVIFDRQKDQLAAAKAQAEAYKAKS
ncbi:hypothetical protein HWV62_14434 [Athelia sp. TMB]|nr:hypothetical protein HWV62_40929 [Athelia sp. TMB]KAF7984398.1 hypothetical protein HWV62_14434 [Athelia sp. TMB]